MAFSPVYMLAYIRTYYGFVGAIHTARRDWDCLLRSRSHPLSQNLYGFGGAGMLASLAEPPPLPGFEGESLLASRSRDLPCRHISLAGPRHPRAQTIPQWKPTLIMELVALLQA